MSEIAKPTSTLVTPNNEERDTSTQIALSAAEAADDRKGGDIVVLKLAQVSYITDYFVLVTGFSKVQVRAIAQAVQEKIETNWQRRPQGVEGVAEGSWVLLDYGDVIVNIMMPTEREFYNLEAFWGHAERIEKPSPSGSTP